MGGGAGAIGEYGYPEYICILADEGEPIGDGVWA